MYVCMCIYIYIYIYVCMYVCIYIYIYIKHTLGIHFSNSRQLCVRTCTARLSTVCVPMCTYACADARASVPWYIGGALLV